MRSRADPLAALIAHPDENLSDRIEAILRRSAEDHLPIAIERQRSVHQTAEEFRGYALIITDASIIARASEHNVASECPPFNGHGIVIWTPAEHFQDVAPIRDLRMGKSQMEFITVEDAQGDRLEVAVRHAVEKLALFKSLWEADQRSRLLLGSLPSAVYTVPIDDSDTTRYMSDVIEDLTGYPAESWSKDGLFGVSLIDPRDRERFRKEVERARATRQPMCSEYRYIRADGSSTWVRNEAKIIVDPETGYRFWHGVIYDISSHKAVEAELAERGRKQEAIAKLAYESVEIDDLDAFLDRAVHIVASILNVEFAKILEMTTYDEFLLRAGVGWRHGLIGKARVQAHVETQAGYTLRANEPVVVRNLKSESRFSGPDLLLDHGVVSGASVVIHGMRKPYGVLGAHTQHRREFDADDVSFLQSIAGIIAQRIERETREEELRFQASLLDAVDQAVIATDLHGTVLYWSRAAEDLYGWTVDEVLGRHILDITPSMLSHEQSQELMIALRSGESWTGEVVVRRRDGSTFWAQVTDSPIHDQHGELIGIIGISSDVTERHRAAEALREAEIRYRSLIEQVPAIVFTADPHDVAHLLYQSPQVESFFGYTAEEWINNPHFWLEHIHPDDLPYVLAANEHANQTHEPVTMEYRIRGKDSRYLWLRDSARMVYAEDGTPLYWQGVSHDVTELKEAQQVQQLLAAVVTSTNDAIISWTRDRVISSWNRGAEVMYGRLADEAIGQHLDDQHLFPAGAGKELLHLADRVDDRNAVQNFEMSLLRGPDDEIFVSVTVSPIVDDHGRVVGGSAIARDVTDQKELERQLTHQAFHDPLTGLPNRALFLDRLTQALQRSERHQRRVAVLFIDLDNFKVVNDSLGHARGDQLLIAVAKRLRGGLRESDTMARMGGDEFTVLLEDLEGDFHAEMVVRRLFALLRDPFEIGTEEVQVTASIGVALSSDGHDSPDDLVRGADTAMYRAKSDGKARHALFDEAMHVHAVERLQLEQQLRRGLEQNELELHYQPFWSISDRRIIGVEALVRWNHPERGLLVPAEFLWIARETGLIMELDAWVLREAVRQGRIWNDPTTHHPPVLVSVNLSGRQFQRDNFDQEVARVLEDEGLPPDRLMLEITENDVMGEPDAAAKVLDALKQLGIQIAVDDFGTGYSSLSHLKRFPIDFVKIDKNFIGGMEVDSDDIILVAGLIRLAQEMGMQVIAEGVETGEQLQMLRELQCDLGQGYLLHRPMPEREFQLLRHVGG